MKHPLPVSSSAGVCMSCLFSRAPWRVYSDVKPTCACSLRRHCWTSGPKAKSPQNMVSSVAESVRFDRSILCVIGRDEKPLGSQSLTYQLRSWDKRAGPEPLEQENLPTSPKKRFDAICRNGTTRKHQTAGSVPFDRTSVQSLSTPLSINSTSDAPSPVWRGS